MDLVNSLTANAHIVSNLLERLPILAKSQDPLVANDTYDVSPHIIILHELRTFVNS